MAIRATKSAALGAALLGLILGAAGAGAAAPVATAGEGQPPYFVYPLFSASTSAEPAPISAQQAGQPSSTSVALTGPTGVNVFPDVSLDGRVLAYLREHQGGVGAALVVRVDGRLVHREPIARSVPDVAADGSSVTWVNTDGAVVSYSPATARITTLCAGCGRRAVFAALSPDGSHLALRTRSREVVDRIWIRALSGSRAAIASVERPAAPLDAAIAWSPDGRQIAFAVGGRTEAVQGISTLRMDGRYARTAFRDTDGPLNPIGAALYGSPAWINGAVWAVRAEGVASLSATLTPVTAPSWQSAPVALSRPLLRGSGMQVLLSSTGAWAAGIP